MNWLGYSIIALIIFSGYDLLSRKLGVQSKNPVAFGAVFYLIATLCTPLLLIVEPLQIPIITPIGVLLTGGSLLAWILFGRVEYTAHKHVEASVLTILLRLGPVITFILSMLFLDEHMTLTKLIGLLLTIFASVLVIGKPSFSLLRKGLIYGVALALTQGVAWTFDKIVSPIYGVVLFSALSFLAPSLANMFIPPISIRTIIEELHLASWKIVVLAILNIVGYAAMIKALIIGEASSVIPIATATPPLVVLGGVLLLHERKDIAKKCIAVVLVVLAIYLMR